MIDYLTGRLFQYVAGQGSRPSLVGTNGHLIKNAEKEEGCQHSRSSSTGVAAGQVEAPRVSHSQFLEQRQPSAWKDCMLTLPVAIVTKSAICPTVDHKAFAMSELGSSLSAKRGAYFGLCSF